ncbi:MAG: hypothetical protein HY868_00695 [Chloroflexi bacterium]|nr:hypothetical protein [Chloroflexota bacterium]
MFLRKTRIPAYVSLFVALAMLVSACGGGVPSPQTPSSTAAPTVAPIATSIPALLTATSTPRALPTMPVVSTPLAVQPQITVVPRQTTGAHWSDTQGGLTVIVFFDPYPFQFKNSTTIRVVLTDATGQPITDASVELNMTHAVSGMEGEHDETLSVNLENQGRGTYVSRSITGQSDWVTTGIGMNIQRGGQSWSFSISKDELSTR